jgi:hypothetical protein
MSFKRLPQEFLGKNGNYYTHLCRECDTKTGYTYFYDCIDAEVIECDNCLKTVYSSNGRQIPEQN